MSSEHVGMTAISGLLPTNVSKVAQDSLRELKGLRIFLTKLLVSFDKSTNSGNMMDTTCPHTGDAEQKDSKIPSISSDDSNPMNVKSLTSIETFPLHKLVNQIESSLDVLDHLASRMHNPRLGSRKGELGLCNALSMYTKIDQLDFAKSDYGGKYGDDDHETDFSDSRRVDWLTDRADAERWVNRYWERTHTILEGLLSCSAFRRSHLNSTTQRKRVDFSLSNIKDVQSDLEYWLSELHQSCPRLTITLVHTGFNVSIAHVRVGDVMQCFINFRRLHPERIIVRGLNECMLIPHVHTPQNVSATTDSHTLSPSLEELLKSKCDGSSSATTDMIACLLSSDQQILTDHANTSADQPPSGRGKRGMSGMLRPVLRSPIPMTQLDLTTPSQFHLFQRISSLAQSALLHFSKDYTPPSAVRGLLLWLNSYYDLYTAPCGRCGNLLGHDISLPLWRSYLPLRKEDPRSSLEPQHEHCQAIN